ncbi:hypothetical protein A2U01_0055324 [Trifolium medium]|uniref:Uncharacterized protein n=1 Tax=Trifolium medium TaxID=97028 RepID=A0A392RE49_9FABA|nr:hypothetical protein [Trifolium medium]
MAATTVLLLLMSITARRRSTWVDQRLGKIDGPVAGLVAESATRRRVKEE